LTFLFLLAFCASSTGTEHIEPAITDRIQTFTKEIERLREGLHIPGLSVAVLHSQQIMFAQGFGYADIKNKIRATAGTPYNIASLTKPFAAAVLMKLVEAGQLNLDDKMADILKDTVFKYPEGSIHGYASACERIREMSKVTSSPYAFLFQDYRCHTENITVRHHLTHTAHGVPGDTYRYNGFLYGLLSHVADEISAKSFRELLVENIIDPLEMTRTLPNINKSRREQVLAERAKYYRLGDTGDFVASGYKTDLSAAAGIISTVLDLAKFDVAMDRNLIVSQASKKAMFTPTISNSGRPLPYGLGWFVQEYRGVKLVWHYGWAPKAYSSLILKVPEEKVTLILLANSEGASAPFNLRDGNVLTSPFAVEFLNLVTDLKIEIPITGAIQNVHEPGNTTKTYMDIVIGKGFTGKLPDDIDSITVTGPSGDLPISKDDFTYIAQLRDFWIRIPGSPEIGTYTFTVTSGKRSGSSTDTQSVLRTIPLPDTSTFSPAEGGVLRSSTPTFSWEAVKAEMPIYYRLEIHKLHGGRAYATDHVKSMLSHSVAEGVLKPGQDYRWRVRVTDGNNWINVQNRSHSEWRRFKTAQLFESIYQAPKKPGGYPGRGWQKIRNPELLGWSSEKLAAARAYSEQIGSAAVMIVEDGIVVDAWGEIARKYFIHSMRKPLMSALIGIHVAEGHINLSKTMEELGIDDNEPSLTKTEKQATVVDLIKSRSGIYHPALGEAPIMKAMRPKRHSHAPGTFYYYNNWDFNAVGTIFEQETGTKIFEEFDRRIAKPVQMEDFSVDNCWYESGDASRHRYYGFRMSARDLARFGLLYLREGRWKNKQIVSSEWVRESTATHSVIGSYRGYGYMWSTSKNGGPFPNVRVKARTFGHSGLGVHFFIVLPSRNLVIVHRVNTDTPGPYPNSNQLGRLLWLILDAAGETEIGENPSIDAAKGFQLTADNFEELLGRGTITAWGVTPPGLVERSEKSFIASVFQDGTMTVKGGFEDTGKWWFERDEFCIQRKHGKKHCHYLVLDGKTLEFYSLDGTLDFQLLVFKN
jgi:CubicO group peptidase (beta-lactamase class C family)